MECKSLKWYYFYTKNSKKYEKDCINSNNLPLELEDGLENLSYIIDYIYKYRNDGFNGMFPSHFKITLGRISE